jgi:hypothetical protein
MDEGRKRVIGIMAAILASLHMETADDLFGTPQGSGFVLERQENLIGSSRRSQCAVKSAGPQRR